MYKVFVVVEKNRKQDKVTLSEQFLNTNTFEAGYDMVVTV